MYMRTLNVASRRYTTCTHNATSVCHEATLNVDNVRYTLHSNYATLVNWSQFGTLGVTPGSTEV